MLGYEAVYMNDSPDKELLSKAKSDSLVLLTADEQLYRTASIRGIETLLVQGRTEPERLASLAERYNLRLVIDTADSRCPQCGYPIRVASREEVKSSVLPTTFKVYRSFWVCTNPTCAKVYWQGSHWKKIGQTLESAKKILEAKRNSATSSNQPHLRRRQDASSPRAYSH